MVITNNRNKRIERFVCYAVGSSNREEQYESILLDLKYRALWVDYENDGTKGQPGYFEYDTVTHGSLIGFIFKF
jgi:hypothetical protein